MLIRLLAGWVRSQPRRGGGGEPLGRPIGLPAAHAPPEAPLLFYWLFGTLTVAVVVTVAPQPFVAFHVSV